MRTTAPRWAAMTASLALAVAVSCAPASIGADAPSTGGRTTPPGTAPIVEPTLTFYRPTTVLGSGRPGDIVNISATSIDPSWPGVASRITYVSTTPAGDPVPVTGVVLTPAAPRPPDGYPIVVWAHGTVGLGDPCAPSRFEPFDAPGADQFLAAGYLVVAPDYEGLGIENETHPYLVGAASGHNVLDAARAGQAFGGGNRAAAFGWSQGGHAALFARELAPAYAPEIELVGVVAAAPVTDPATFLLPGRTDPAIFPFTAEAILAWSEVYQEPELDDLVVAAEAERVRLALDESCTGDLVTETPLDEIFLSEPQALDIWRAAVETNEPGATDLGIPVLLTHGDADELVPIDGSIRYHDDLCRTGEEVQFERDTSWGHTAAWGLPLDVIVSWIEARFSASAAPTDCPVHH